MGRDLVTMLKGNYRIVLLSTVKSIVFIDILAVIDVIPELKQCALVVVAIGIVSLIVADGIRLGAIFRLFGFPTIHSFVKMWSLDVVRSNTIDAGYRLSVFHWAFFIAQWWAISIAAFILTHELVFLLLGVFWVLFF
jgi:hypothetical protein